MSYSENNLDVQQETVVKKSTWNMQIVYVCQSDAGFKVGKQV